MSVTVFSDSGARRVLVHALAVVAIVGRCALGSSAVHALELEGVKLADRAKLAADGADLMLNGAGVRGRAFFRIYVAGLYLTSKRTDAKQVLADKGPKRISMTMLRDVTAQQLNDALTEGIRDNHTASEVESLKIEIDELVAVMAQIGIAKTGSVVTLDYLPGTGTRVTVNGTSRGKPIAGDDLYPALLRIWLGDDPADRGLRRALLGR